MITHSSIGYNGRLGNQMFQYAALKALALDKGYDFFLPNNLTTKLDGAYDLTNNKWIPVRLELLDCFTIPDTIIDTITPQNIINSYNESTFTYNSDINNVQDYTKIDGYFQSYKYFERHSEQILKDFQFKPYILEKCNNFISKYTNTVSIHIRRGDYVMNNNYWNVTVDYINQALQYFNDLNYTYLVFSDDLNWCKEVFPEEVIFVNTNNAFEDLCLMSLCEHNIISNSSYSWWGAYLNKNYTKRVIAPSNWFNPPKPLNDLYPSNWITI